MILNLPLSRCFVTCVPDIVTANKESRNVSGDLVDAITQSCREQMATIPKDAALTVISGFHQTHADP